MGFNLGGAVLSAPTSTSLSLDSGTTNWMKVNSTGLVQRTQLPFVQMEFSSQGANLYGYPINPATIYVNQGSCWNPSTGLFTCPTPGRYILGMTGLANANNQGFGALGYYALVRNGNLHAYSHWNGATAYIHVHLSAIANCAAGDTLGFAINTSPSPVSAAPTCGWYAGGGHGSFYIGLVR